MLEITDTESLEMLKTIYKDGAIAKIQVFEWLSRFLRGKTSIDNKLRSVSSSTAWTDENVEKIFMCINMIR